MLLVPEPGAMEKTIDLRNRIGGVLTNKDSDDVRVKKLHRLMMDYLHYYRDARSSRQSSQPQVTSTSGPGTRSAQHIGTAQYRDQSVTSGEQAPGYSPEAHRISPTSPEEPYDDYDLPTHGLGTPLYASTPYARSEVGSVTGGRVQSSNSRPPTEQELGDLITALTQRPDILGYNSDGEMVYHGVPVPDTDILDLMSGADTSALGRDIFNAGVHEVLEGADSDTDEQ